MSSSHSKIKKRSSAATPQQRWLHEPKIPTTSRAHTTQTRLEQLQPQTSSPMSNYTPPCKINGSVDSGTTGRPDCKRRKVESKNPNEIIVSNKIAEFERRISKMKKQLEEERFEKEQIIQENEKSNKENKERLHRRNMQLVSMIKQMQQHELPVEKRYEKWAKNFDAEFAASSCQDYMLTTRRTPATSAPSSSRTPKAITFDDESLKLRNEIGELKLEKAHLQSKVGHLEGKIDELKMQCNGKQEIERQLTLLKTAAGEAEKVVKATKKEVDEANKTKDMLQKVNHSLADKVTSLNAEKTALNTNLDSLNLKEELRIKHINDMGSALKSAVNHMRCENATLKTEIINLRADHVSEVEEYFQQISSCLKSVESTVTTATPPSQIQLTTHDAVIVEDDYDDVQIIHSKCIVSSSSCISPSPSPALSSCSSADSKSIIQENMKLKRDICQVRMEKDSLTNKFNKKRAEWKKTESHLHQAFAKQILNSQKTQDTNFENISHDQMLSELRSTTAQQQLRLIQSETRIAKLESDKKRTEMIVDEVKEEPHAN